jgi:hypothetical protein
MTPEIRGPRADEVVLNFIVFPTKERAIELLTEIACTPIIDGVLGGTWVCPVPEPESGIPPISLIEEDGGKRVVIIQPWNTYELEWLKSYMAGSGVIFSNGFPDGFKIKTNL